MALYEGIALIQEKQAVVLDLGSEYTKFGLTGEAAPRAIVRSQFYCPQRRRLKRVDDYRSPDELYDNLVHMLHQLYFRHVLVNPKERKVVVVESLLTPTLLRETLAKVLFMHYEVSGVVWCDSGRAAALALGAAQVLALDVGAREAAASAVIHGSVVVAGVQAAPLGMNAVTLQLATLLDRDNGRTLNLDDTVLEDIRVKTCFVIDRARAEQWRQAEAGGPPVQAARDVMYGVSGGTIRISGRTRELAAEVLFERDNELSSLPDIVLHCITSAAIDARRPLAENILVYGGGAEMTGLKARLAEELRHLVTVEPYKSTVHVSCFKFHSPPAHANSVAWCGAACACAGEAAAARATARDVYARRRAVPDWPCLLDNTPPHHPSREHEP